MDNEQIKSKLKGYFESGDVPTEDNFRELIDEAFKGDASRLIQGKVDSNVLPKGSEIEPGIVQFATPLEVDADANDRVITPKTLNAAISQSENAVQTALTNQFTHQLTEELTKVNTNTDIKLASAVEQTDEKLRDVTEQTDTKLASAVEQTDEKLRDVTEQTDTKLASVAEQTDEKLRVVTEQTDTKLASAAEQTDEKLRVVTEQAQSYTDTEVSEAKAQISAQIKAYSGGEGIDINDDVIQVKADWFDANLNREATRDWLSDSLQSSQIPADAITDSLSVSQLPVSDHINLDDKTIPTTQAVHHFVSSKVAQKNVVTALPPKTAIPFWGQKSELLPGWVICDGGTYHGVKTPDLRHQFIRGANSDEQVGSAVNATTGMPQNAFSIEQNSHAHGVSEYQYSGATNATDPFKSKQAQSEEETQEQYWVSVGKAGGKFIDVDGKGGIKPQVSDDMAELNTLINHAHDIEFTLDAKDTSEVSHSHALLGGDDETAPQHILMYWITFVGEAEEMADKPSPGESDETAL